MSIQNEIVSVTQSLIRFQTITPNLAEQEKAINWIINYLISSNLELKIFKHNKIKSLLIKSKNTKEIDVLLNGHVDVVAPAGVNQFEPKISGDKLYGRGALDMKSGLAVLLLFAKYHLSKTNHAILVTTDEETGGANGCRFLTKSKQICCEYFITAEPTNLQVVTEEKGPIWVRATIRGKACHASKPWEGKNPILTLNDVLSKIYKEYPLPDYEKWQTTICATRIDSSNSQNQIPAEITVSIDCRYIASDNPQSIIKTLKKYFDKVEIQLLESSLPKIPHPYTEKLVKISGKPEFRMHYATDARHFSDQGIPSVVLGPIGENMHGKQEWVSIRSLTSFYQILEKFLL